MNNDPCKTFKNIYFWDKEIEKQTKIATHMDLWKYGQILIIQKSLIIIQLNFQIKDSSYEFIILYYIIYWIPITNLECESIHIFSFCDGQIRQPIHIFRLQKSITTNKWVFLSNNNYTIFFLMEFLV